MHIFVKQYPLIWSHWWKKTFSLFPCSYKQDGVTYFLGSYIYLNSFIIKVGTIAGFFLSGIMVDNVGWENTFYIQVNNILIFSLSKFTAFPDYFVS